MENKKEIRVRMAPSPTGTLHVGTARTALFNYLFAKSQGGTFVLRIEDTDTERSKPEYEENILWYLEWLGIRWNEGPERGEIGGGQNGPYRQSDRGNLYRSYLEKMLQAGTAFYCWHTTDELQAEQAEQTERKEAPRHNCSYRDAQDEHAPTNPNAIIRYKNDHKGAMSFRDAIKGDISFDASVLGDFSVAKSLDSALYNFAVVVDDHEMKISHVIRGEDHISNTPKQLLLQEALGFEHPEYAHLPLLLGSDRSKLSKRHGATSLAEYKRIGYTPRALFNFLALLGWRPAGEQEIMSEEEIIKAFSLSQVQTSPAIFDVEKLNWMNGEYLRSMSAEEFLATALPFIEEAGMPTNDPRLARIVSLEQQRVRKLAELPEAIRFAFELPSYEAELLRWKEADLASTASTLSEVLGIIESVSEGEWSVENIQEALMPFAETKENRGVALWPLRVSLSGQKNSPGPFEIMAALGKEESVRRIQAAIQKAQS